MLTHVKLNKKILSCLRIFLKNGFAFVMAINTNNFVSL